MNVPIESGISIKDLNKKFTIDKKQVSILENINIDIKQGEFVSIIGSSGCGKSTLLRIIAGLDNDYEGTAEMDGQKILKPSLKRGVVFQEHRLFPWLTVSENISFGLKNKSRDEKKDIVKQHLELVGLNGFEKAYPGQLSGGMSQRVSIARALANDPEVLLMDEPFGALDALTRIQMQEECLKIWNKKNLTIIFVTHDIDEAIYLGDKIVIISQRPGKVKKIVPIDVGRPRDRNSHDFSEIRKLIYKEFFSNQKEVFNYTI
ncbi:ABC transporter ATP-binding protein [Clostridium tyrobutyricum]|uniref:ABC transporter ATP-binding protein n=1 Tax=Clostridium tyrobutyricum TaxID=1519 RepID=UPI001C38BA7B|nr:ABC transporter ATP-binding protein [Clostridium tyrobutyricum]MBV4419444.1 ABC transporter ATP-binding protein [Clostridium tyrobutyricum]